MRYKYVIMSLVAMLISGCATQFPNLLIKDNPIDDGISIPKDRAFWLSPDIWLDNDNDGIPDEIPIIGKSNKLFAKIYNIGSSEAKDIKVKFYANKANTYFSFKDNSLIGTNLIHSIRAGESVITSIDWDVPKETGCWSFGVAVDSKEDSITSDDPAKESNLAYKSFWNVYTYAGTPVILGFNVENPFPVKTKIKLVIDTQKFPVDWNASLGKTSFDLLAKESKPVLLIVTPAINPKNEEGIINVIARVKDEMIGGISYRIKVK